MSDRNPPRCSVPGCDREVRAKALCHLHYTRMRRNGEPGPPLTRQRPPLICSAPGCPRESLARGLCTTHYYRPLRTTYAELDELL